MIYKYGITVRGISHEREETICQDAHMILINSSDIAVCSVSDGLGSEVHSDFAAQVASRISVQYCAEHISPDMQSSGIIGTINDSFNLAQDKIENDAYEKGYDLDQCDATLSLVVYFNGKLFYGHSGDSGIIALTENGMYIRVTEQQRDDQGRVFPLYWREKKWEFGEFPHTVAAVLLATDGMLETFSPIYLQNNEVDLHVHLLQYFMDKQRLHFDELGEEEVRAQRERYIFDIPGSIVDDDKTLAVLLDTSIDVVPKPESYYAEPDWEQLKKKWEEKYQKKAYPEIFAKTELQVKTSEIPAENNVENPISDISSVPDSLLGNETV